MSADPTLRRYTNVLSLLDMLRFRRLTLLNPARWFDQNDALGLRSYSQLRGRGSVYAACFAQGYEQAHHWQIFAGDNHGLAIVFNRRRILEEIDRFAVSNDILHGPVQYHNLTEIREMDPIPLDTLPFLKRDTFKSEQEYRVVAWEEEFAADVSFAIPIGLEVIDRIVMGPSMPDALARSLKEIAQELDGCAGLAFSKSRLVNNESWAEAIEDGLKSHDL